MSKASSEHLQALVNERQADVRQRLDALVTALASNDQAQVQADNDALSNALHALSAVVAASDRPQWFNELLGHVDNYKTNHANGVATWRAHLLTIIRYWAEVQSYTWFTVPEEPVSFDVDAIIVEVKSEFKIDELFSNMVAALESLAKCDELDSVKACADLERLIRILRRSQSGSFTSQVTSWRFARRFVANLISAYLKESKVTGPLIKAFEQTANELDVALDEAKDRIGQQVLSAATSGFRSEAIRNIGARDVRALPDLREAPIE